MKEPMPVNYEVKGHLARLLATENLLVENKKVKTASFDVERRLLTLPMWERASAGIYDLLVAHEVGHALYTPNDQIAWDKINVPKDYVNVTEDARVEKLMKRRYAGLAKTFYRGYQQLSGDDFFEIENTDVDAMSFADRVNLYFKIGNFIDINFSSDELEVVKFVGEAETFEDAVEAARRIYQLHKDQKKQVEEQPVSANSEQGGGNESPDNTSNIHDSNGESDESSSSTQGSSDESEPDNQSSGSGGSSDVTTDDIFSEKVSNYNSESSYSTGNEYIDMPDVPMESFVVDYVDLNNTVKDHFSSYEESDFEWVDGEYKKFIESSKKEVNYMVKEFECKKTADAYSRSSVARTGVLDTTKLHTYKYNDDLFKKVNIIPDGKNHGLIFVLDWSGSMSNILLDTVKQLLNLISFCKKVHIPFEVYAFTNAWGYGGSGWDYSAEIEHIDNMYRENQFYLDRQFRMINMVSSRAKTKDLENSIRNLWRLSYAHNYSCCGYSVPPCLMLSGTPMIESVIALHKIVPYFQNTNKLQKVNVVILTDGDSAPIMKTKSFKNRNGFTSIGTSQVGYDSYLRNRKTGETYKLGCWFSQVTAFLRDFSNTFSSVNLIGIRILGNRDWSSFASTWILDYELREKLHKQWKKNHSAVLPMDGFKKYFALSCNSLDNDVQFEVAECATKSQIRSAFKKSLNSKALNKKILSEFIELVA